MLLHEPFKISARLLPALQIDDAWLSLEHVGITPDNRDRYRWYLDIGKQEFTDDELRSGVGGASLQAMFASLLDFLCAAGESYWYATSHKIPLEDTNAGSLFPLPVVEWAHQHSDELSLLRCEIEESEQALIEE